MRRSLFDNATLIFDIPNKGYIDDASGKWITPTPSKKTVRGDLQPYVRTGAEQVSLPEGFKLNDAKMFICSEQLPTINDFNSTGAARTTIKDRVYYVATKLDFSDGPLTTDTIFYILSLHKLPEAQ